MSVSRMPFIKAGVAALMVAIGRQECIKNLTFRMMWVAVSLPLWAVI